MATATFFIVAALAVASAVALILKRNPIHGALFLVVNLACVAVLFLSLGAEFLAAAQVIVYAGAIMVLFVFAIMVLIPGKEETGPDPRRAVRVLALPIGGVLLVQLVMILAPRRDAPTGAPARPTAPAPGGSAESLGQVLFTDYLFPFELTSILLLAAMVGVLVLARRRPS